MHKVLAVVSRLTFSDYQLFCRLRQANRGSTYLFSVVVCSRESDFVNYPRSSVRNLIDRSYFVRNFSLSSTQQSTLWTRYPTRKDPVIMKLKTPEFKSIFTPELEVLAGIFKENGYEIRLAGGPVRDLLSGKTPSDLDFATTATPDQMKEMFTKAEIRMLNLKGEKHGTITVRINDKVNYEITTLRIDTVTYGRHADVQFITDWEVDAGRRDLTFNSLFLGLDGTVYDYYNGYEDLKAKRIAFVGDAVTRIQEDYLRILRYFRFYAIVADQANSHEESTIQAIRDNAEGLSSISGERIWVEMRKILNSKYAGDLMHTMLEVGIGPYVGLPSDPNLEELVRVWTLSKKLGLQLQPMTLLAALLRNHEEVMNLHSRLKLSAYERDLCLFVIQNREDKPSDKPLKPYMFLVIDSKFKQSDVLEWVKEVLKYRGDVTLVEEFSQWKPPRFPVSGHVLKESGVPGGKHMNAVLQRLKDRWKESEFSMDSQALTELIPSVMSDLGITAKKN